MQVFARVVKVVEVVVVLLKGGMGNNEWPHQRCNCWSIRVDGRLFYVCQGREALDALLWRWWCGGGRGGGCDFT